jgi:formyltetrahydrofolate deformylase
MIGRRLCDAIASAFKGQRSIATMRVCGPDKNGLVATSTELLYRSNCTILQSEHYSDKEEDMFFQRIVFDRNHGHPRQQQKSIENRDIHQEDTVDFEKTIHEMELSSAFQEFKESYEVNGDIDYMRRPKRIAIFVSKLDHCLWELLLRHQAKELARYGDCVIALVISNHEALRSMVEDTFRVPFIFMPKTPENKLEQEDKELQLCQEYHIDLIVLARYMQILSPKFLHHDYPIINIHHSFLPAFRGRRAYHQAHDRGVKLIGATVRFFVYMLCIIGMVLPEPDAVLFRPTILRSIWTRDPSLSRTSFQSHTATMSPTFAVRDASWNEVYWCEPCKRIWQIASLSTRTNALYLVIEANGWFYIGTIFAVPWLINRVSPYDGASLNCPVRVHK